MAKSIAEVQDEIVAEFDEIGDPLSQYELLLEYSAALEGIPPSLRTDEMRVKGCQSNVWLSLSRENGVFHLDAASDTLIICGILNLLERVFNGRLCAEVADADIFFLEKADLMATFDSTRRKGIGSAIKMMQRFAAGEVDWPAVAAPGA